MKRNHQLTQIMLFCICLRTRMPANCILRRGTVEDYVVQRRLVDGSAPTFQLATSLAACSEIVSNSAKPSSRCPKALSDTSE